LSNPIGERAENRLPTCQQLRVEALTEYFAKPDEIGMFHCLRDVGTEILVKQMPLLAEKAKVLESNDDVIAERAQEAVNLNRNGAWTHDVHPATSGKQPLEMV
jgi:hypothetical protein